MIVKYTSKPPLIKVIDTYVVDCSHTPVCVCNIEQNKEHINIVFFGVFYLYDLAAFGMVQLCFIGYDLYLDMMF